MLRLAAGALRYIPCLFFFSFSLNAHQLEASARIKLMICCRCRPVLHSVAISWVRKQRACRDATADHIVTEEITVTLSRRRPAYRTFSWQLRQIGRRPAGRQGQGAWDQSSRIPQERRRPRPTADGRGGETRGRPKPRVYL
ncbi:hypothetical protein SEVIR_1G323633v4 [Setaria viridis]